MRLTLNDQIIESILFLENKPVGINKLKEISGLKKEEIIKSIDNINAILDMVGSPLTVIKNDKNDFHLTVRENLYEHLKDYYDSRKKIKLSQQAIETLAIIAYKQPITKIEIEAIRGVQVGHIIKQLLEYGLIKITGKRNSPGKPILYGTTDKFLKYFGLLSLKDLPPIEEFDRL